MVAGVSWYGACDFKNTVLFNPNGRDDYKDRFGPRILKPDTKVEIFIIKNAGHNWRQVEAPIDPSAEVIVQRTVSFFMITLNKI